MKAVIRVETAEQGVAFRSLVGCKILEVFAVGKELFLVFGMRHDVGAAFGFILATVEDTWCSKHRQSVKI